MSIEIGTSYHLGITKRHIITMIEQNAASEVLKNWKGTDEEAIEHIQSMPGDFIPWDTCDNYDENGKCLGHSSRSNDEQHRS